MSDAISEMTQKVFLRCTGRALADATLMFAFAEYLHKRTELRTLVQRYCASGQRKSETYHTVSCAVLNYVMNTRRRDSLASIIEKTMERGKENDYARESFKLLISFVDTDLSFADMSILKAAQSSWLSARVPQARVLAAWLLANFPLDLSQSEISSQYSRLLSDPDDQVRSIGLQSLWKTSQNVERIRAAHTVKALGDRSSEVRRYAYYYSIKAGMNDEKRAGLRRSFRSSCSMSERVLSLLGRSRVDVVQLRALMDMSGKQAVHVQWALGILLADLEIVDQEAFAFLSRSTNPMVMASVAVYARLLPCDTTLRWVEEFFTRNTRYPGIQHKVVRALITSCYKTRRAELEAMLKRLSEITSDVDVRWRIIQYFDSRPTQWVEPVSPRR